MKPSSSVVGEFFRGLVHRVTCSITGNRKAYESMIARASGRPRIALSIVPWFGLRDSGFSILLIGVAASRMESGMLRQCGREAMDVLRFRRFAKLDLRGADQALPRGGVVRLLI